jgi:hypothetical protein
VGFFVYTHFQFYFLKTHKTLYNKAFY